MATKDEKEIKPKATTKKVAKKATAKKKAAVKKKAVAKKKTTTKKAVGKKRVVKKVAKKASTKTTVATNPFQISMEERWRMIATAAYYKAEARQFSPGHETEDWLAAEAEIDALLSRKR